MKEALRLDILKDQAYTLLKRAMRMGFEGVENAAAISARVELPDLHQVVLRKLPVRHLN